MLCFLGMPNRFSRGLHLPVIQTPVVTQVEITPVEPTFVGRDVCRECHAENYRLHGHHGHKSTWASTRDPEIIKMFDGKTYDAGEPYGTYTYHTDQEGLFVRIPDKFGDKPFRLEYALGSAHGAVTLISLIPDGQQGTVASRAPWQSNIAHHGSAAADSLVPRRARNPVLPRNTGGVIRAKT